MLKKKDFKRTKNIVKHLDYDNSSISSSISKSIDVGKKQETRDV